MIKIDKQIIETKSKYGTNNQKKYITIHETDNTSETANAQAHANLQRNGYKVSWHYQVDQSTIIQSFPHEYQLWHSNDNGNGNMNSIAIEMCVNKGNDYLKTLINTIELVKKIMKEENIPIENVVQHNHWNNKNCPRILRSGTGAMTWKQFINKIAEQEIIENKYIILDEDGYLGIKTISRLQEYLGTPADGKISKPSLMIKELQRRLNLNRL